MSDPIYLLVKLTGPEVGFCEVYERVDNRDVLVWTGLLADLNEDEFPITGIILEEDILV